MRCSPVRPAMGRATRATSRMNAALSAMAGGASMMSCEDKLKLAEAALSAMETHVLPALATKDAEIARLTQELDAIKSDDYFKMSEYHINLKSDEERTARLKAETALAAATERERVLRAALLELRRTTFGSRRKKIDVALAQTEKK